MYIDIPRGRIVVLLDLFTFIFSFFFSSSFFSPPFVSFLVLSHPLLEALVVYSPRPSQSTTFVFFTFPLRFFLSSFQLFPTFFNSPSVLRSIFNPVPLLLLPTSQCFLPPFCPGAALWSGTNKNRDVSTGPLARPFARSFAPLTR